jgi:hypothetical protein
MSGNSPSPTRRRVLAASVAAGAVSLLPIGLAAAGGPSQSSNSGDAPMAFETLTVSKQGAVLFAEIAARP